MKSFEEALEQLVAVEMATAIKSKDAPRCAAMQECLTRALGMVTAMICNGDAKGIDTLLEGTTQYLYETTGMYQQLGQLISATPEKGAKPS